MNEPKCVTTWNFNISHPTVSKLCFFLSLAPPAPQNVSGVPTGSTSLSLYWSPSPNYQNQSGRIRYYHINITDATTRRFTTNNTQLTVSSLHPYSTYQCTVAAVTVAQGPPSTPITIQTYQDGKLCLFMIL